MGVTSVCPDLPRTQYVLRNALGEAKTVKTCEAKPSKFETSPEIFGSVALPKIEGLPSPGQSAASFLDPASPVF